ncbi:MAG TPA: protein translocase subunit SecD [Phycisphaerae bacterium]|nr:protein translocase subunit SecD [Phycisphaerae bacterium]HNU45287.1 protein translocase subunit SecD [Phycisphaerae bacterium]
MSDSNRLYKWLFVIVLVVFALTYIYPPSEKLKGGIDLVGGTSLLFEIDTTGLGPEEQRGLAGRVTEILKERVDPGARLNLEWRPIGNNRLEIRMPRPTARALDRRAAYNAAQARLLEMGVKRFEVESALNAPASERPGKLEALRRGVPERGALLEAVAQKYDAFQAAQRAEDPVALDRARDEYEEAMRAVLATTLPLNRLTDLLDMAAGTARDPELQKLRAEYPAYDSPENGQPLSAAAKAYDAWHAYKADLEDPADLKRRLKGAGVLEFRILADRDPAQPTMTKSNDPQLKQDIGRYVEQLQRVGPRPKAGDRYRWFPVHNVLDFMHVDNLSQFEQAKTNPAKPIVEAYAGRHYALTHNDPEFGMLTGRQGQETRWSLRRAYPDRDPLSGKNVVHFILDPRGGSLFGELTGANVQRQLCIFLDGVAMSHATIQERIGESCQISGNFSVEQVQDLARTLQAGALPARLKETPLMEKTIGPSLGLTNRTKGLNSTLLAFVLVIGFMAFYYGIAAGGMADVAVTLNVLFILCVMALTQSTFTLPGIAGVILTVGMAVDANVLIFERVREERDRGVTFRKALNAGYDKAFSTILDANLTTLITCVVLGFMGSEEVKGFATTLGVGITTSMFTALFVTRLAFNSLISIGWLKDFSMRRIIGVPQVNWLALRAKFWPVSLICVLGGAGLFAWVSSSNREALYDIEFLGGTTVQIDLREGVELTDEQVSQAVTSTASGTPSAVNWLRRAAEQVQAARVEAGDTAGQFVVSSPDLTGEELATLLRGVLEADLERGGIQTSGRSATFTAKPGTLTVETFQQRLTDAATAARRAADHLRNARVQSVTDLMVEGRPASSYEIVTVETNRPLVQAAVVAALSDKLKIERALSFTLREDTETTRARYFVIEFDDQYLSDVLGGDAGFEVRRFKGGVAMQVTLDPKEEPVTVAELERRLREIRLQPEFEQYQARDSAVIPLGAPLSRADGQQGYREFAVCVGDPALLYDDDPQAWESQLAEVELAQVTAALEHTRSLNKVTNFEPQVAGQVQEQAIFAVAVALVAILAYIWLRFGTAHFGLAAVVALVHDVSITLGLVTASHYLHDTFIGRALALSDFKIDLAMMASLLTVIGYSLNDTIVVFDRIRENRGRLGALSPAIINNSINQTLSRTLLTSFTTLLVVFLLYVFGGQGVHGFAFALLVGVGVGTYSSIAIAAPLLYRPKALIHVTLIIVLLGAIGMIMVLADSPAVRLVLVGLAVLAYLIGAFRAQRGYAVTGAQPAMGAR